MPSAVALRPRSFAELFDAAFLLARAHLGPLATLSAMVAIPSVAINAANVALFGPTASAPNAADPAALGRMLAVSLLSMCWYFVGSAALVHASSNAYLGEPVDAWESLRRALRRAGAVIGSHLLAYLAAAAVLTAAAVVLMIVVGGLAVTVKALGLGSRAQATLGVVAVVAVTAAVLGLGAAVLARFVNVTAVVMLEGAGAAGALRRSNALAAGHLWRIVGLFAVAFAISIVFVLTAIGLGSLAGNAYVANIVVTVLWVPLYPLLASVLAALYYDLRIRKEGFDIARAAEAIGAGDAAASAPAA